MTLALVTGPSSEPVSLADAKSHLHVDEPADDGYISAIIAAARDLVEAHTGRALLSQQWRYTATSFPQTSSWWTSADGVIYLGRAPLVSVDAIHYVDTNGTTQLLASNQYLVDADYLLGRVSPAFGVTWPFTRFQPKAVEILFTVGYASVAAIPSSLIAAMKLIMGELYQTRESTIVGTNVIETPTIAALLDPWRLPVIA